MTKAKQAKHLKRLAKLERRAERLDGAGQESVETRNGDTHHGPDTSTLTQRARNVAHGLLSIIDRLNVLLAGIQGHPTPAATEEDPVGLEAALIACEARAGEVNRLVGELAGRVGE